MRYYKRYNSKLNESYGAVNDPKVIDILEKIFNDCYEKFIDSSMNEYSEKYPFSLFKNTIYENRFINEIKNNEYFILEITRDRLSKNTNIVEQGSYNSYKSRKIRLAFFNWVEFEKRSKEEMFNTFVHEFTHMINLISSENYTDASIESMRENFIFSRRQFKVLNDYINKNTTYDNSIEQKLNFLSVKQIEYTYSKTELNARLSSFDNLCKILFKKFNIKNLEDLNKIINQTYFNNGPFKNIKNYLLFIFNKLYITKYFGEKLEKIIINNYFDKWDNNIEKNLYNYKDIFNLLLKIDILFHINIKDNKYEIYYNEYAEDDLIQRYYITNILNYNLLFNSKIKNNNLHDKIIMNFYYYTTFYILKGYNRYNLKYNMKYKYDENTLLKMCLDNELAESVRQKCAKTIDHIIKEFLHKLSKIVYMNLNKAE